MKEFVFAENPIQYRHDGENIFTAVLKQGLIGKSELLDDLATKLIFPDYFGFNWDALSDLLRDFHWLREKEVMLIHLDLPHLDNESLKVYLEVLLHAVNDWKEGEEHSLEVVFPEVVEKEIFGYFKRVK